ncbi:MAG: hypothetical protein ACP5IZ_05640 [Thermoprotei archaeon]
MEEVHIRLSRQAMDLLEYVLFSNVESIEPRVSLSGVSYSVLGSMRIDESVFNELTVLNIFEPVVVDRFIKCPKCGSNNVRVRLKCPKCGSHDLQRKLVLQHRICGFTDVESSFRIVDRKREAIYECPKCKGLFSLSGSDHKELGRLYECQSCSYRTNSPNVALKCQVCDNEFSITDAQYAPVFAYKINYNVLMNDSSIKSLILKDLIKPVADKFGINLIENYESVGFSGITQRFELVLEKDSNYVAVMFMFSENENDVMSFLIKATDCRIRSIILANRARKISDYVKNISKFYNSQFIVGDSKEELREKLEDSLKNIIQKVPNP